jgi:hypothetical protein
MLAMRRRRSTVLLAVLAAALALNAGLLLAQPGLALPRSLASFFFGPNLVRAEAVLIVDHELRDYRIDRGRITAVRAGGLRLRERDGTVVTTSVAPGATVTINGQPARLAELRRGMNATVVRNGDQPAETIEASGRRQ